MRGLPVERGLQHSDSALRSAERTVLRVPDQSGLRLRGWKAHLQRRSGRSLCRMHGRYGLCLQLRWFSMQHLHEWLRAVPRRRRLSRVNCIALRERAMSAVPNGGGGSHCGHIVSANTVLGVCDSSGAAGICVQCTGAQSSACGANICDSLAKVCSPFPAGTARICQPCISDANCAANSRCVLETFGQSALGYKCVPLAQNNACPLTPFSSLTRVNTIDGTVADACLLRRTTCTAFNEFSLRTCAVDADCGEPDLDDGRCITDSSLGTRCSIPCGNGTDCPSDNNQTCLGACLLSLP
jgi:hypothetical protein